MSVQAIAAVFKLDLPPLSKWILVCLADNADNFGGNIFPTITTLSQKSSIPERTLQRHLKALVESKVLEVVRVAQRPQQGKAGRGTEYRLSFMTNPMASAPRPNYQNCPTKLRLEVIEAFQETCAYCGRRGNDKDPDGQAWHVDRIIPGSRGGNYSPENIALSCGRCNIRKGAKLTPIPAPDLGAKRIEMGAKEFVTGANPADMGATAMAHNPLLEPLEEPLVNPSPHSRLMALHSSFLVGPIPNGAAQGAALKWLLERYESTDLERCYLSLRDDGWRSKVTWMTVKNEIGEWLARRPVDPARGAHHDPTPRPLPPPPPVSDDEFARLGIKQ